MFDELLPGFAAVCTLLYVLSSLPIIAALFRKPPKLWVSLRSVSVIVAARNEVDQLPHLLPALAALEYPRDLLQILLVDDHSDDGTTQMLADFAASHDNVQLLQAPPTQAGLNGKASAVDAAIRHATGEILLVTDADCTIGPGWVRAHVARYERRVGMTGGFVWLTKLKGKMRLFDRLQAVDWLYLCAAGAAAAAAERPLSIFGNNFAFRKEAYEGAGGFAGAGFSVIEDFALMKAVHAKGWRVVLSADSELAIETRPISTLREFHAQRKRWAVGGRAVSRNGKIALGLGLTARTIPWLLLAAGHLSTAAVVYGSLFIADAAVVALACRRLHKRVDLVAMLLYPAFSACSLLALLPAYLFARDVEWKGRRYEGRGLGG